jgi:hypothetical protein
MIVAFRLDRPFAGLLDHLDRSLARLVTIVNKHPAVFHPPTLRQRFLTKA